ncbi:MAG: TIGR03087 family PEP-CTERM/XrtA system glycosyltransferase [Bacteroidia bacterium]
MKILFVTSRVPWPLEKGDKLRAFHQLVQLSKKHEIVLFCLNDAPVHPQAVTELKKFCSSVHIHTFSKTEILFNLAKGLFSKMPFQVAYFTNHKALRAFEQFTKQQNPDRIFCQLIRTAEYGKLFPEKVILDYMDVFSKGVKRRLGKVAFWKRPAFKSEYNRLIAYERSVSGIFRGYCIISEQDKNHLPALHPEQIHIIPNGVDTDFFSPSPAEKKYDLLFNGNMNYPPNIESAVFLVKQILPLVHKIKPQVNVLISGAHPAPEVLELAGPHVTVTGWVDDIRTGFNTSRILVAPMQSSIGLQNKLLEAMAMKLPCITSVLSNNALKAVPGKEIIVCSTPQEYADSIIDMLDHPEKANAIAENGHSLVLRNFGWQMKTQQLEELITR